MRLAWLGLGSRGICCRLSIPADMNGKGEKWLLKLYVFCRRQVGFRKRKKNGKKAKKVWFMGADPVKNHRNFTQPPAPSHFLPSRAPQAASFVLSFSCAFFPLGSRRMWVRKEPKRADFFPCCWELHTGHMLTMPMLRLMGTIGNLRARPSGGGQAGGWVLACHVAK